MSGIAIYVVVQTDFGLTELHGAFTSLEPAKACMEEAFEKQYQEDLKLCRRNRNPYGMKKVTKQAPSFDAARDPIYWASLTIRLRRENGLPEDQSRTFTVRRMELRGSALEWLGAQAE